MQHNITFHYLRFMRYSAHNICEQLRMGRCPDIFGSVNRIGVCVCVRVGTLLVRWSFLGYNILHIFCTSTNMYLYSVEIGMRLAMR